MQTSKDFLHIFLDMGDALLNSGAEIFRVEDTLNRMGYACGAAQMNVFSTYGIMSMSPSICHRFHVIIPSTVFRYFASGS